MTKRKLKIFAALGAALLVAIIVLQNTESVSTKLLFVTVQMPRAVLLFVVLTIGFALGIVFSARVDRKAIAGGSKDRK